MNVAGIDQQSVTSLNDDDDDSLLGSVVVKALYYKPGGREFEIR
jgi:hypothetical protein